MRVITFIISATGLLFLFGAADAQQSAPSVLNTYSDSASSAPYSIRLGQSHVHASEPSDGSIPLEQSAPAVTCDCVKKTENDTAKPKCDCEALAKKVAGAYKGVYYDNDFSYLSDPCYSDWHLGEKFKRMRVGKCWTFDIGGEYRLRFQSEQNFAATTAVPNGLGLTGDNNDFLLQRTRLFINAERGKHFRIYGEMLDADSQFEKNLPRGIEENRSEMQNMFAEIRDIEFGQGTIGARIGRQEILLGSQRLVSPLDWANTRRTFDGGRVMWKGPKWDIDAFHLRPLKRDRVQVDSTNLDSKLYGVWSKYKGLERDNLEVYWLGFDNANVAPRGFRYDTIGSRYWGDQDNWLYELEGGVQFGKNADASDHSAGFATAGMGRKMPNLLFKPTVWLWYDWASGDDTVGNGFNHILPLAHKYLGLMDFYGRRNIQDINIQSISTLNDKTKLLLWYHYFMLANGNDVPYNVTMTPFAGLAAGSSGSKDLGQEIDCVLSRSISPRSTLLLGYSHFFAGDYYARTPGVPFNGDADFFYTQWHINF